jgi:hypothetical protein
MHPKKLTTQDATTIGAEKWKGTTSPILYGIEAFRLLILNMPDVYLSPLLYHQGSKCWDLRAGPRHMLKERVYLDKREVTESRILFLENSRNSRGHTQEKVPGR